MYPRTFTRVFAAGNRVWQTAEADRFGVRDVWWSPVDAPAPGAEARAIEHFDAGRERRLGAGVLASQSAPWWGTFRGNRSIDAEIGMDMGCGWPWSCLWYRGTGKLRPIPGGIEIVEVRLRGGWLLRGDASLRGREGLVLPLMPIPSGLVFNSLVWGAAWWTLLFAPARVRSWRRGRRGCCVTCGYRLEAAPVCPECGGTARAPSSPSR